MSITKETLIEIYEKIIIDKERLPTYADFVDYAISQANIKTVFGNLTKLHAHIENEQSEIITNNIAHELEIFGKKRLEVLSEDLLKYKKFVITTAVTGKKVDPNFYKTLKFYCQTNDALLLIIGCSDVANSILAKPKGWTFDTLIRNEHFISKETQLNSKFFISNIKMTAKQIDPTTGLGRFSHRNGSWVFASPKQFLEVIATSSKTGTPAAMMTTGAITVSDYSNDRYMSERTSYIAENDHVMGAIVVEIQNDKEFHFRQVQANSIGEFVDLGKRYMPCGKIKKEKTTLVLGDWHSGHTSQMVIDLLPSLVEEANVQDIVIHDLFNGTSVNHHIQNSPGKLAKRAMNGQDSLVDELIGVGDDLDFLASLIKGTVTIVKSNHDEWLERYLDDAMYAKDPLNHYVSLDLAKAYLEGVMPLKYAVETLSGMRTPPKRFKWLDRNDDHKIATVELGQHGDIGSSGKGATMKSIEKDVGRAVVGHIHSAAILRGIYRVGTSTDLVLDYNKKGASNWTNTHALVSNDGSVQLVTMINGRFKAE